MQFIQSIKDYFFLQSKCNHLYSNHQFQISCLHSIHQYLLTKSNHLFFTGAHCICTIVHWGKRFFPVPNSSAGSDFVKELTRSLQQYIVAKGDHGDALFLFFSLPSLMLQRSSEHSKTKDDVKTLRRRLDLWQHGNLRALLDEGQCL